MRKQIYTTELRVNDIIYDTPFENALELKVVSISNKIFKVQPVKASDCFQEFYPMDKDFNIEFPLLENQIFYL